MKQKTEEFLSDLWAIAKGNRTIILQMLWLAIETGLIPLTGPWLLFARGVLGLLTGKALQLHHKAGYFSKKKLVPER